MGVGFVRQVDNPHAIRCSLLCTTYTDQPLTHFKKLLLPVNGGRGKKVKFNAMLTTYEILQADYTVLSEFKWATLTVDEVCAFSPAVFLECLPLSSPVFRGT